MAACMNDFMCVVFQCTCVCSMYSIYMYVLLCSAKGTDDVVPDRDVINVAIGR